MRVETWLIAAASIVVIALAPLAWGMAGTVALRRHAVNVPRRATRSDGKTSLLSTLLFTLAFNLTFLVQELCLVLPKAFTPGLRPTLFHNNHSWEGDNPLAALFQGTGALATLITGLLCLAWLRRSQHRSITRQLLLFWLAYCGCFMALPQVAMGAINPASDVGMAMQYLQLGPVVRVIAGWIALAAIPVIALRLARDAPLAADHVDTDAARSRTRAVFRQITLPALIGMLLVLPFREPRELIEVVIVPMLVVIPGIAWIQAGAWWVRSTRDPPATATASSIGYALIAVVALLLVFQLVLRPGIRFY